MQSPVPSLSLSLRNLSAILTKAEAYCSERKIDPVVILTARLYPDMLNLTRNVLITCDTAKGAAARLSGTENPSYPDTESTFAELQARIRKTLDFMGTVPDAAFKGAEDRVVELKFGPTEYKFGGSEYLMSFVMPNFYFHMATVHGLLRHNGVAIGKRDFLGS